MILTTDHSPFTIHYSLFTIDYSPLTKLPNGQVTPVACPFFFLKKWGAKKKEIKNKHVN
jgi:hypothetical protein